MIRGEQIVWNIRATVDIGEHSQWGRIDDDGVLPIVFGVISS